MNVYRYSSYKKIIEKALESRRCTPKRVTFQQMAEATRIPRSYVSRVIRGDLHFSSDQLFSCCRYLEFSEEEIDYLELLLEAERSSRVERKKHLVEKIRSMKRENLNPAKQLKVTQAEFSSEMKARYYLNPLVQIVHTALSIGKYASNPSTLAEKLNVKSSEIEFCLKELREMGLIEPDTSPVRLIHSSIHLDKVDPVFPAWQKNIRTIVAGRISKPSDRDFQFSVLFTADKEARIRIQQEISDCLKKIQRISEEADDKNVYAMSLDFSPMF